MPIPFRKVPAVAIMVLAIGSGVSNSADSPASKPLIVPSLQYEKYKLPNGLEVILHENHRLPLVAVDVWYHVGPINERAGRTGFAHLFEHMMFEGSEHVGEKAHFGILEGAGATGINGTTDFDRTNYFETVPSNQLELALWLESDRMGFLLEKLDRTKLTNQRDVVRNERRQGENSPYSLSDEQVFHLLFPKGHPYYADVMGSHSDIEAARLNDIRDFFRQFYTPNNATIALAGDFEAAKLKPLIEKYFGPIPAGPPVAKVTLTTPSITSERRATLTDTVQLPRVAVAWLAPRAFQEGDAETQLLIQILGGGKSSRLYRKLIYEGQIAQSVDCSNSEPLALASVTICNVTARPAVKPETLEAAIDKEVENLRDNGVTQPELDRARNMILARKIENLQRLGGFGGVADMMNLYNQYLGDPGYLQKDVQRFQAITVASLQAVAQREFANNQRVVVSTIPGKKVVEDVPRSPADTDADIKLQSPYSPGFEAQQSWRNTAPSPGPPPELHLPSPNVFALANGMKVYLVEDHSLPVLSAALVDLAGADGNPLSEPGLAGFTARMLTEGTTRRSSTEIADDSDQLGAELHGQADTDAARATIEVLSNHSEAALELLGDVTQHPAFQTQEVERIRKERLGDIVQESDNPIRSTSRVGQKVLYGNHAYGYPPTGTKASVQEISRDDLSRFWAAHYGPQNAALVLSGDLNEGEARRLADKYFGRWTAAASAAAPQIPPAPDLPHRHIVIVDKPGAPQTALLAFGVGLARTVADYPSVEIMNSILGGLFSSRINMNLREKNGFTYAAFSFFRYRRGAGPFITGALIRTDVTGPATRELFAELERIHTDPPTAAELRLAQQYALRSLPGHFETVEDASIQIGDLFVYKLPVNYYRTLPSQYEAVTPQAVQKAAEEYVHPENLVIVAVGDRAKIQPELEKLNLGPIELRNESGDLVSK
ncbi:MAG: pitrilysin family protein [Bryobacteraceae bacterium]